MICLKNGYNIDALTKIGQPMYVLSTSGQDGVMVENDEFDALSVWDNGTYSSNEFSINWIILYGNPHVVEIQYPFIFILLASWETSEEQWLYFIQV